jgi:hypothetical protein
MENRIMASIETATLLDEVLDFLVSTPTPEQIIAFRPSEVAQERVRHLLDRNRNGTLSTEENEEIDEISRMNHFVSLLKVRARKKLAAE